MIDEVDYVVLNDVIKMSNVVDVLLEAIPELLNEVSDEERISRTTSSGGSKPRAWLEEMVKAGS